MLIDSHCHLDFSVFDASRDRLMQQAKVAGITKIIVPGVQLRDFRKIVNLHQQWPSHVAFGLGLHPCFIDQHPADAVTQLTMVLDRCVEACAIGEIGLDARPDMAPEAVQVMLLEEQLKLARDRDLPVILHVVKAHDRMLSLLRRYALPQAGVVHAYSGSFEQAHQYAKLGFKLGFGGAMTYTRAVKQQRLVKELPLEWLLLETDAPDMPLEGFQHQPNSPLQVVKVAEKMADIRGLSVRAVAEQTQRNANELFKLMH